MNVRLYDTSASCFGLLLRCTLAHSIPETQRTFVAREAPARLTDCGQLPTALQPILQKDRCGSGQECIIPFHFSSSTSGHPVQIYQLVPKMATTLLYLSLLTTLVLCQQSSFSPARPPAIPLAVRGPYLSSRCPKPCMLLSALANMPQLGKLRVLVAATEATSLVNGHHSGSKYDFKCL